LATERAGVRVSVFVSDASYGKSPSTKRKRSRGQGAGCWDSGSTKKKNGRGGDRFAVGGPEPVGGSAGQGTSKKARVQEKTPMGGPGRGGASWICWRGGNSPFFDDHAD